MTIYTVHYIDGDHDTFEADKHTIDGEVYTLSEVYNDDERYVEVDIVLRNVFSIRREKEA